MPEFLGAQLLQPDIALLDLLGGHAILGIAGVIHNGVTQCKMAAGIVAAADQRRDPYQPIQKIDMGNVVQIDNSTQLTGQFILRSGGLIGREHDLLSAETALVRQHQFHLTGTVHTAALFLQDLQNTGRRRSFYGKIFPEPLIPGKRLIKFAAILTDPLFIVQMKRRRIFFHDFLQL